MLVLRVQPHDSALAAQPASTCVTVRVCAPGLMQPVGIVQLRLSLCSKGRLTNSAQQHSTSHYLPTPAGLSAASESSCLQIDLE